MQYRTTYNLIGVIKYCLMVFLLCIALPQAKAQINSLSDSVNAAPAAAAPAVTAGDPTPAVTIGGNVYGGGNQGRVQGETSVTVYSGDIQGNVFGGARMADVGGSAFVHIDGENMSGDITINQVFGGNDIAGTVGVSEYIPEVLRTEESVDHKVISSEKDGNNKYIGRNKYTTGDGREKYNYNAFVYTTPEADNHHIYIGQAFGGGNGDYQYPDPVVKHDPDYPEDSSKDTYTYSVKDNNGNTLASRTTAAYVKPVLEKIYLNIHGGTFGYVFGGGNNATITKTTNICINNKSTAITHGTDALDVDGYTRITYPLVISEDSRKVDERLMAMGLNLSTFRNDRLFIRVFGGNNKAEMKIRPTWHLEDGSIYNLYSGGNAGPMTSSDGILLDIPVTSKIAVDNVFGGCRMADVNPKNEDGTQVAIENIALNEEGYEFPNGFSARVIIRGGTIQNVYGGNDITGNVRGGTAVGIRHNVYGNIYGGGNGSYAYTDNPALKDDLIWGDFYYDVNKINNSNNWSFDNKSEANQLQSVKALNQYRPNVEQVSIRIKSESEDKKTIIGGAIYVGGNSASIKRTTEILKPKVHLKLGSYVIADSVFLGNNGINMTDASEGGILYKYANTVYNDAQQQIDFSSLNLKNENPIKVNNDPDDKENSWTLFDHYMEGITMKAESQLLFDGMDPTDNPNNDPEKDYKPYTSFIGSLFCGGNVGSMRNDGTTVLDFAGRKVVIYDKLVGGCNNAYVPPTDYNVEYEGGLLGEAGTDDSGKKKPKVILDLAGLKIQPMRWKVKRDPSDYNKIITDETGNITYLKENGDEATQLYERVLEWNTVNVRTSDEDPFVELDPNIPTENEGTVYTNYRFFGGNVYGGCYNSGHVNGDVVININGTIMDRFDEDKTDLIDFGLFDEVTPLDENDQPIVTELLYQHDGGYQINKRRTGVILNEQGMDVLGSALNVFGGGYGKSSEIWGNTTININKGFVFQVFGGGEMGAIGKHTSRNASTHDPEYDGIEPHTSDSETYNTYINLHGTIFKETEEALSQEDDNNLAECIFAYGGGFEGLVCGDTHIYLGNGRIFNSFAGSCNADILGHTETYIGKGIANNREGKGNIVNGFPWVIDLTYGGNDLGGSILGYKSFLANVRDVTKVYQYSEDNPNPAVLEAGAYTEYTQGRADGIFGGHYGDYDYEGEYSSFKTSAPRLTNAFVNFKPNADKTTNHINRVYGGTQGNVTHTERDMMQDRSYVLVDIPSTLEIFHNTEFFGAGDYSGIGMNIPRAEAAENADGITAAAVIDLVQGKINAAYGGSYQQGFTRRTIVNVPEGSTIEANSIFGGAYGIKNDDPCDVYEANVNYNSADARIPYVYGGNNNYRRTLYSIVNINSPIQYMRWDDTDKQYKLSRGTVYGSGYGKDAWSQYTEVNLNPGAFVWEAYGGGYGGEVLNKMTAEAKAKAATPNWNLTIRENDYGIDDDTDDHGGLTNPLAKKNALVIDYGMPEDTRYNTNVHINEGAEVENYCYGGGYGQNAKYRCKEAYHDNDANTDYAVNQEIDYSQYKTFSKVHKSYWTPIESYTSGNVSGTTYIDLLGGKVRKDLYGAGTTGAVKNISREIGLNGTEGKELLDFVASSNVYIKGGTVRNVYGGGWEGAVGYHNGLLSNYHEVNKTDILGETHVYIGLPEEKMAATDLEASYASGDPAIQRNVYGGGEGGPIIGTTYLDIYNGHIGYTFENTAKEGDPVVNNYVEKLHDETYEDGIGLNRLKKAGNAFGGGYVANSNVDISRIALHGGIIRGGLYGGGEIGPIGRGSLSANAPAGVTSGNAQIYKYGETHVFMYGGVVLGDVFGGGRGFDNLDGDGYIYEEDKVGKDLSAKGYVFGTTDVQIHRGVVGSETGLADGFGNVFGGGNIGFVYGGRNDANDEPLPSVKKNDADGYYYENNSYAKLTEDCRVDIRAYGIAKEDVTFNYTFQKGEIVTDELQDKLKTILSAEAFSNRIDEDGKVTTEFTATLKYKEGEFIHNRTMNTLQYDDQRWNNIDQDGITIHNAIFAGGNVSAGSDQLYANETTVYGNVTASVVDLYDKDLITVGDDGIGGLYGDGNLTLVDGYRELNITNYGTDYDHLMDALNIDAYNALTERQKAYYELKFKAKSTHPYPCYESKILQTQHGVLYKKGQKIGMSQWEALTAEWDPEERDTWKKRFDLTYEEGEQITEKEFELLDAAEQTNWDHWGFCTLFEGRMINTIQRADFCGVWGSRVVMRGAQDRVISEADYTDYTINRIRELSLNQINACQKYNWPLSTDNNNNHGNYFGIYNVVNYLGALTSDVDFHLDKRKAKEGGDDSKPENLEDIELEGEGTIHYGDATYYQWKKANRQKRKRNNGTSENQVALASGVWLEILDEETELYKGTDDEHKVYGPITGVIELKLVNVTPDEGGGYVYAKNVHGERYDSGDDQVTVASSNYGANSYKRWSYEDAGEEDNMQTSGNFIHPVKQIIDDCYPMSNSYVGPYDAPATPAHYWYIRGEYYVYDQYISAYTGTAQAYAKTVSIPLTITAESQGKLLLMSVNKNRYASWVDGDVPAKYQSKSEENAIVVQGVTYHKNDVISYWDWSRLTSDEQDFFTDLETYVCTNPVTYLDKEYKKGDVFETIPADLYVCQQDFVDSESTEYKEGDPIDAETYASLTDAEKLNCAKVFNPSNAVNHENGFVLSFDWDNPDIWSSYHQYIAGTAPDGYEQKETFNNFDGRDSEYKEKYALSPTYRCEETGVYGQMKYIKGDIIEKKIYDYQGQIKTEMDANHFSNELQEQYLPTASQATFEKAYVAKEECEFKVGGHTYAFVKGTCVSATEWATFETYKSYFDEGMFCTEMFLPEGEAKDFLYGEVYPKSEISSYSDAIKEAHFSDAYICTSEGEKDWGGGLFISGHNYNAINYSNLSKDERDYFTFNYDALDLLIDNNYDGYDDSDETLEDHLSTKVYDHPDIRNNDNELLYSKIQRIDYEAKYGGESNFTISEPITLKRLKDGSQTEYETKSYQTEIQPGDIITNIDYENLKNEQFYYTPFIVKGNDTETQIYIATEEFKVGDNFYMPGNKVSASDANNENAAGKYKTILRTSLPDPPSGEETKKYYFCTATNDKKNNGDDTYTYGYKTSEPITDIDGNEYDTGDLVPIGTIITYEGNETLSEDKHPSAYKNLVNQQKDFIINGKIPTETSTFYVARETDIDQLSKERIITVIYQYDYIESDEEKTSYEKIRERHIVNVHITFESGAPTIGTLLPPKTVIPGNIVGLNKPSVSKGAYDLLGGGWEIYSNADDAITHKNGTEYQSGSGKVYWYQDEYYIAYYAKSYLGKTYSNSVPLSVANYHRMDDVMNNTHIEIEETDEGDVPHEVHDYMYLDKAVKEGKRKPKVYINSGNELKQLKDFFDCSKDGSEAVRYTRTSFEHIKEGSNIDFILDGDPEISESWTPIATRPGETDYCFEGTLHGDGHTITGLDNSLFDYICGDIYNLGVTGSYTTAGVANHSGGKVVNTWTYTTGTPADNTYPIVGSNDMDGEVFNSYYYNDYKDDSGVTDRDTYKKPIASFLNGEVAFNLNSHYLNKRYYKVTENTVPESDLYVNYIEKVRYGNKDFIYAGGAVPETAEPRDNGNGYTPFYPTDDDPRNDYIYFGQTLTYDFHPGDAAHQEHPMAISNSRRVFRAPGYYRSKEMKSVYYNQDARFKDTFTTSADGIYGAANTYGIHNRLTAIDFTGDNDYRNTGITGKDPWAIGGTQDKFYAPILDHWGITGFRKSGVTRNLLVYADKDKDGASHRILESNLPEATLNMESTGYKRVFIPDNASNVTGHLVSLTGTEGDNAAYIAERNHYLVDKEDFNAPIKYKFVDDTEDENGTRMWYQRKPDDNEYVSLNAGWEGISIPFEADLVSTQTKGEITHFYKKKDSNNYDTDYDSGHEYWLRKFTRVEAGDDADHLKAIMNHPVATGKDTDDRTVSNTFLWDYYYRDLGPGQHDHNEDIYQVYYKNERVYPQYPLLAKATPYLIGFPGDTYYEFDLSGKFIPEHTFTDNPQALDKQTISFVSKPGIEIEVSDEETCTDGSVFGGTTYSYSGNDYTFKPSYLNEEFEAGTDDIYVLNTTGDSFEEIPAQSEAPADPVPAVKAAAFRPFFTSKTTPSPAPRRIIFGMGEDSSFKPDIEEHNGRNGDEDGGLNIAVEGRNIVVSSTLSENATVHIHTISGVGVTTFTIEPGQIVRTPVNMTGVYIVNRKKVIVK